MKCFKTNLYNCNLFIFTATANREVEALLMELDRQRDENRQQSEHIFTLEAKLRDIESRHVTVCSFPLS